MSSSSPSPEHIFSHLSPSHPAQSQPLTTYPANCHCGLIKLSLGLPDMLANKTPVIRCNCSICVRNGYLLVHPKVEDFQVLKGEGEMREYRFGMGDKPHRFCGRCGTSLCIGLGECGVEVLRGRVAVNLRAFRDADELLDKVTYKDVDGKNIIGPAYKVE